MDRIVACHSIASALHLTTTLLVPGWARILFAGLAIVQASLAIGRYQHKRARGC